MTLTNEKTDFLRILAEERENLLITVRGITDEQARQRTTVSELTLGGIINHLINVERGWIETIADLDETAEFDMSRAGTEYVMGPDQTIEGLLAEYAQVASATEAAVEGMDLDVSVPLPTAPWAPVRKWQSARLTIFHILREVSHHGGHADIIREALDGANTTRQWAAEAGMTFD